MKQKAAQSKAKTNVNQVQNKNIKNQKKDQILPVEKVEEEDLPPAKVTTRGKQQKTPLKPTFPKPVEVEEEEIEVKEEDEVEDSENAEDSGAEIEADENVAAGDEEYDEEGDDDMGDEEGPDEAPIDKDANGIPKIHSGPIPRDIPFEQILHVQNLPKKGKYKQIDLVEVFGKYGTLHTIKPSYRVGEERSTAVIAYTTVEAANAALAADGALVKGLKIKVSLKKPLKKEQIAAERKKAYEERKKIMEESKDRMLYIKNVKPGTTEDEIRDYFSQCGEVEAVNAVTRKQFTYAFVVFKDTEPIQEALKLHNTNLNGVTIGVYLHGDESSRASSKDPKRTVLLRNVQQLENVCGQKLDAIFSPCGEIEDIDILCRKNVLAFITFKEEESVQKALELNDTEVDDLQIEVGEYKPPTERQKTAVFMQNVKPGTTEEEVREFFANTGEIENIYLRGSFAIIKFTDTDGFCKSFLLNESLLSGQPVFLEPYSDRKQAILRKKQPMLGKRRSGSFHRGGNKKFKGNSN